MPRSRSHLSKNLNELSGDAALAAYQEKPVYLEAIWRSADASGAGRVAGHVAAADTPVLSGLLLDEILAPRHDDPITQQAVIAAIVTSAPLLHKDDTALLLSAIVDQERSLGAYEPYRSSIESWVLRHEGKAVDRFAVDVLVGNHPNVADPSLRSLAVSRCAADLGVAEQLCTAFLEVGLADADRLAWSWKIIPVLAVSPPRSMSKLITETVAAALASGQQPQMVDIVAALAGDDLLELLASYPCAQNPGGVLQLLVAIDQSGSSDQQSAVLRLLLNECAVVFEGQWLLFVDGWDEDGWLKRLHSLTDSAIEIEPPNLSTLVQRAPELFTPEMVELALRWSTSTDHPLVSDAGRRLAARTPDRPPTEPFREADLESCWWPPEPTAEQLEQLGRVLDVAYPEGRVGIVLDAYLADQLDEVSATALLAPTVIHAALALVDPGEERAKLTTALWRAHPAETSAAVAALQEAGFQPDLCRVAVAESSPTAGFHGADAAWSGLSADEQDDLTQLLHAHATLSEQTVLEAILEDTQQKNASRRKLAAERLGEVLPSGGDVPVPLLGLLASSRPELRLAAIEAVARIAPCDIAAVRDVRTQAVQPGVAAAAPRAALDRLEARYIEKLSQPLTQEDTIRFLSLVGAAASNTGIEMLLRYVGGDALDDNIDVRRAAAAAIAEASRSPREKVSTANHFALVQLLDGDLPEVDSAARELLGQAARHAGLGDDAALAVLYEIAFDPKTDANALFGVERAPLVRHLELYVDEYARGEKGWAGVVCQLDLVAERLVRAAYGRLGSSDKLKGEIARQVNGDPSYGELVQALASMSELEKARDHLGVLHQTRNTRTEIPHSGDALDNATFDAAVTAFAAAAKIILGALKKAPTN